MVLCHLEYGLAHEAEHSPSGEGEQYEITRKVDASCCRTASPPALASRNFHSLVSKAIMCVQNSPFHRMVNRVKGSGAKFYVYAREGILLVPFKIIATFANQRKDYSLKSQNQMMFIFVLLVVIALCSCTTTNGDMVEKMVSYDSVTVSIDYPYISDYVQVHPYERADTLFVLGYNHWTHSIDMINMSTSLKHNSIRLEKEGNNGVYNINSLLGARDCIVVMEFSGLKQVSFQGEVLNNIPLLEIRDTLNSCSYSLMNKGVIPGNFKAFAYNPQKNECYVPLTPLSDALFENFCIGAKVNLADGNFSLLDCPYPEPYNRIKDNVGSYSHAQFSVLDEERIIFNFYGNSHFWIYNQNTSEIVRKNMPSRFTENETEFPVSSGDIKHSFESEFTSLRFRTVHYVSSMDLFVRIHHAAKQDMLDKSNKHYLMLMSAQDDSCIEYLLPSSFDGRYFVHGTCVYFLCRGGSDTEIRLGIIDLSKLDSH